MTQLAGRHVLVTGGSEGIGLAAAQRFLQRGATVSLVSRSPEKLVAAQQALGDVQVAPADVTDEPGLLAAVDDLVRRSGPCDVLVAAAGGARPGYVEQLDSSVLHEQMELNYFGAVHAVRAVLPAMLAAGRGHVVLLSSLAGLCGVFGYGGYGPAKAALRGLAEVLVAEHGHRGLKVTVVYPPDTLTPGFARENAEKPRETAAVSALVVPVPPERVAAALVAGVERNRRIVTVDVAGTLLARATSLAAPVARVSMRRAARRAAPPARP